VRPAATAARGGRARRARHAPGAAALWPAAARAWRRSAGRARQAGGVGSTGRGRVLDVMPEKVHQRVPLFIGSKKEVEYLESFLAEKK